jgi:lipopolysaccharide transport system ATP-binding protein
MSDFAIRVEGVSKRYRIGRAATPRRSRAALALRSPFQYLAESLRPPAEDEILWALKDVSFDVAPGEVVGLIGRNGAGKSTLLKMLARITEPTSGRAIIRGRVGSLLEVGTGFHPELTGRENMYLSGAVLGMKRAEIDRKFDEIVAFAEVERFLDTPVKRYSSGMYVRLAFAVAAHLEPEILLVDEVLAVGDASFQQKCLGKMGSVATQGRTVLFVSHNLVAVQSLCPRSVWLQGGQLMEYGETNQVVARYLSAARTSLTEQVWPDPDSAPGNDKIRLRAVRVRPADGQPGDTISLETPVAVEVEYWNRVPDARLSFRWRVFTGQHVCAFTSASDDSLDGRSSEAFPTGLLRSTCYVPGNLLNEGAHRLMLMVAQDGSTMLYRNEEILTFEVLNRGARPGLRYRREAGAVRPVLRWETEGLPEGQSDAVAVG